MANKGLIFIPDISGFSRFVNETEIEHSRLIIQELLEILIDANTTGLEISEIEGDAILFYRFGELPSLDEVYKQVERMFLDFHQSLFSYDHLKYCQCKACTSVLGLTLKVITHYGEFTGYKVRDFNKLIGKDLIVAHQLLKNDIDEHEYWLVTENLLGGAEPGSFAKGLTWSTSYKQTETGQVPFQYAQLGTLKRALTIGGPPTMDLNKKSKIFFISRQYPTDIISMFHAAGDFQYRARWDEGVKAVEEVDHFLPRVGMRCRCIMENGESYIYASSFRYADDRVEFSETDDKENTMYYTIDKLADKEVRLTVEYYIPISNDQESPSFKETQANLQSRLTKSFDNLQDFSKEIEKMLAKDMS